MCALTCAPGSDGVLLRLTRTEGPMYADRHDELKTIHSVHFLYVRILI